MVLERFTGSGTRLLVYAPEVPRLSVAVTGRRAVHKAAARELTNTLPRWDADFLRVAEEPGDVQLEQLRLPFDEASPSSIQRTSEDLTARAAAGAIGRLDRRDRSWSGCWRRCRRTVAAASCS